MNSNLQVEENIVTKFTVKNKPMYLKILWREDDKDLFDIQVFYEDATWTGTYSNELAATRIMKLDETKEEYNRNVKNCLSGNCNNYIFDFTISDDTNSASLAWKKKYEYAVKIHGVVPVHLDQIPAPKDILIDFLLEKNKTLMSDVQVAKETNNNLRLDLETYIQRLRELTENKQTLESTLYGRFVQVLNEKKRRIQLLEENVKSLKESQ